MTRKCQVLWSVSQFLQRVQGFLTQFITRCWCPFKKVVMESSSSLRGHKCRFSTLFVMRPLVSFCRTKPIEVLLLLEQQLDIERLDPQKLWFDWLMGWMWFPCSFLTLTAVLQYVDLIYDPFLIPQKTTFKTTQLARVCSRKNSTFTSMADWPR